MRRIGFLLISLTLLAAAACSSSSSKSSTTPATTAKVSVDNQTPAFNAAFTEYFPSEVKVHPGDTVSFTSVFRGEPHTVTLGTLVQQGLDAYDQQSQGNRDFDESKIPQLAAIPPLLPQGPGDANQVSAQPCFLKSGNPPGPGETPCAKADQTQPEFDGTESFFNSGFLPNGDVFNVKLSSNIKPGTYRYFCTLHTTSMEGKITVVSSGTKVPTAADNQAAADAQLQKDVTALQPGVDQAKTATPDKAVAGVVSEQAEAASATIFGPPTISIPVNGSVTWSIIGAHTIAFNAPESAKTDISKAPDGSVHGNPQVFAPTGGGVGQPQQPQGAEASTTTTAASSSTTAGGGGFQLPPPKEIDGGSFNGSGFYNTGLYLSFPAPDSFFSYKLKFTKAGTYSYACLIHPGMEGTVKVG